MIFIALLRGLLTGLSGEVRALDPHRGRYFHLMATTTTGFACGGGLVPKKVQKVLHPLITCTLVSQIAIATYAFATSQPLKLVLRSYLVPGGTALAAPGNTLLFLLGPATLSFAFQMFGAARCSAPPPPLGTIHTHTTRHHAHPPTPPKRTQSHATKAPLCARYRRITPRPQTAAS